MTSKQSNDLPDDQELKNTVPDKKADEFSKKIQSDKDKIEARKKVELLLEKKRLKEELGDLDDFDL